MPRRWWTIRVRTFLKWRACFIATGDTPVVPACANGGAGRTRPTTSAPPSRPPKPKPPEPSKPPEPFRVSRVSASQSRQSCQSCHIPHLTRNLHIYINAVVAMRQTTRDPKPNFILPRLSLALRRHPSRIRASPSSPPLPPRPKPAANNWGGKESVIKSAA